METKKCNKCEEYKELTEFYIDKRKKDGLCNICISCEIINEKECKSCHETKKIENFSKMNKMKDGYLNFCKNCCSKRLDKEKIKINQANYRDRHKEKIKKKKKDNYNPEYQRKFNKSYYERYSAIIIENKKKYNKENKDRFSEYRKEYNFLYKERRNKLIKERYKNDILFRINSNIRRDIHNCMKKINSKKTSRTFEILGCSYEEFKIHIESQFEPWMTWENWGCYTGNYKETWQLDHIIPSSSAANEDDVIKLNHYLNFRPLCSRENLEKSDTYNLEAFENYMYEKAED